MLYVSTVFWLSILGQGGKSTVLGVLYLDLAVWSRKQDEKAEGGGQLLDISEPCGTNWGSHFPTV